MATTARDTQLLEQISDSLRRANALAIAKELFAIGAIDDWAYTKALLELADLEGYDFKDDIKKKDAR